MIEIFSLIGLYIIFTARPLIYNADFLFCENHFDNMSLYN